MSDIDQDLKAAIERVRNMRAATAENWSRTTLWSADIDLLISALEAAQRERDEARAKLAAAVEAEREACAAICDDEANRSERLARLVGSTKAADRFGAMAGVAALSAFRIRSITTTAEQSAGASPASQGVTTPSRRTEDAQASATNSLPTRATMTPLEALEVLNPLRIIKYPAHVTVAAHEIVRNACHVAQAVLEGELARQTWWPVPRGKGRDTSKLDETQLRLSMGRDGMLRKAADHEKDAALYRHLAALVEAQMEQPPGAVPADSKENL